MLFVKQSNMCQWKETAAGRKTFSLLNSNSRSINTIWANASGRLDPHSPICNEYEVAQALNDHGSLVLLNHTREDGKDRRQAGVAVGPGEYIDI